MHPSHFVSMHGKNNSKVIPSKGTLEGNLLLRTYTASSDFFESFAIFSSLYLFTSHLIFLAEMTISLSELRYLDTLVKETLPMVWNPGSLRASHYASMMVLK